LSFNKFDLADRAKLICTNYV